MEQTIKNIPTRLIQRSPLNPRKTFDEDGIRELAENIERQGLLQPITVRVIEWEDTVVNGGAHSIPIKYEIVCGERRWRAWLHNQQQSPKFPHTIPCIVREMTDEEAFDAMITENLQRKDVDPIEEAFAFAQLSVRGKSVEEIANRFGKSVKFIRERIKLDTLLPELKKWVSKDWMHIGAAIHIAKLSEDDQRRFMEQFEPDEDDDEGRELEPITRQDAVSFTDNLFKRIESAVWDEGFTGPCGCVCERCEYNNANVGCLFNDLQVKKDDACCTNNERWTAKRVEWYKHIIDKHADRYVKQGEELTPGKMVIAHSDSYYGSAEDYQALKAYCTEQGYLLVDAFKTFERWQNLNRNDEATRKKLMNGEAYVVVLLDSDYRGADVREYCWALRPQESKDGADGAKVAQLVREYKSNIDRNKSEVAMELRKAFEEYDFDKISWKALTPVEWEVFLTMLINSAPYNVKDAIMGGVRDEAEFVQGHNDADWRDKIIRMWMRGKVCDSGIQYYPTLQACQSRLVEAWGIDDVEVKAKAAAKLRKKQDKIEKELTRLGYDTEGKKLDF